MSKGCIDGNKWVYLFRTGRYEVIKYPHYHNTGRCRINTQYNNEINGGGSKSSKIRNKQEGNLTGEVISAVDEVMERNKYAKKQVRFSNEVNGKK